MRQLNLVSHRQDQDVRLREFMPQTEVHREHVQREIHSRCAMQLRHQHRSFRNIKSADNSVKPFASANSAGTRTELGICVPATVRLRDLKWDLKTRRVFREAATNR